MVSILAHTPVSAATAYQRVADGGSASDFGSAMSHAVSSMIHQSAATEVSATQGLTGQGDMTHVVTAVTQAQLALQTTVAIRDRLVQAYQSIVNMPI